MTRLTARLAKYVEAARVTLATNLTYIGDLFLRSIFLVVVMFVFIQLWRTTYSVTDATVIDGYTLREMIWYLVLTETFMMGRTRVAGTVDEAVKSGSLAYSLSKPYSFIGFQYVTALADSVLRSLILFAIGGTLAWVTVGPLPVTARTAVTVLSVLFLSATIDFAFQAAVGMLAFWMEDTRSLSLLYDRFLMLLGGMMLPLDVFPAKLRAVVRVLPFNAIVYGPAKLFVLPASVDRTALLLQQSLWLVVAWFVLSIVFRLGVRRVNVQGG